MDYESLFNLIPKEPKRWSSLDVIKWLEFIGLSSYKTVFGMIPIFNRLKA